MNSTNSHQWDAPFNSGNENVFKVTHPQNTQFVCALRRLLWTSDRLVNLYNTKTQATTIQSLGLIFFLYSVLLFLYFIRTCFFTLIVLRCLLSLLTAQTSMFATGFEPATPARDRPQTRALDRKATGVGCMACAAPCMWYVWLNYCTVLPGAYCSLQFAVTSDLDITLIIYLFKDAPHLFFGYS